MTAFLLTETLNFVNQADIFYLCIMLKRISVLTVLLLYLVTASGFALNMHYCGRILTSVTVNQPAKKCTPAVMKCCKVKHVEVKIKDVHQGQSLSFSAKLFSLALPTAAFYFPFFTNQFKSSSTLALRAPPGPSGGSAIYISNRVFRI